MLALRAWAERFRALRIPPSTWVLATGDALVNWLADAAVLAVSILAVGAAVPWRDMLLVYLAGIGAQSLSLTPGGLAITEGAISVALVASGVHVRQAVAAAVLYRLVSFWLMAAVGWVILLVLRVRTPAAEAAPEPVLEPAPGDPAPGDPAADRNARRARTGPPARPARHRRRLGRGRGATTSPAARGGRRPPWLRREPAPGGRVQRQRPGRPRRPGRTRGGDGRAGRSLLGWRRRAAGGGARAGPGEGGRPAGRRRPRLRGGGGGGGGSVRGAGGRGAAWARYRGSPAPGSPG